MTGFVKLAGVEDTWWSTVLSSHLCHFQSSDRRDNPRETSPLALQSATFRHLLATRQKDRSRCPRTEAPTGVVLGHQLALGQISLREPPIQPQCPGSFSTAFPWPGIGPAPVTGLCVSHFPGRRAGRGMQSPQSQGTHSGCRTLLPTPQPGRLFPGEHRESLALGIE